MKADVLKKEFTLLSSCSMSDVWLSTHSQSEGIIWLTVIILLPIGGMEYSKILSVGGH